MLFIFALTTMVWAQAANDDANYCVSFGRRTCGPSDYCSPTAAAQDIAIHNKCAESVVVRWCVKGPIMGDVASRMGLTEKHLCGMELGTDLYSATTVVRSNAESVLLPSGGQFFYGACGLRSNYMSKADGDYSCDGGKTWSVGHASMVAAPAPAPRP